MSDLFNTTGTIMPPPRSMPDALRARINKLNARISSDLGGQVVCDRLEVELAALWQEAGGE